MDHLAPYAILNDLPDEERLPAEPGRLWLVLSLEIVIYVDAPGLEERDRRYLLLTQRSYSPSRGGLYEGYWVPPSRGYPVELGYRVPQTVGALKQRFEECEASLNLNQDAEQLGHSLGLRDPEYEWVGYTLESKSSPDSPSQHRCYKILRCAVTERSESAVRNLADLDGRKGHVFLPLNNLNEVIEKRSVADGFIQPQESEIGVETSEAQTPKVDIEQASSGTLPSEPTLPKPPMPLGIDKVPAEVDSPFGWHYLSKPIVSNLVHVLADRTRLAQLISRATPLRPEHFVREETGLVVCLDLAGYGGALKYVSENMRSFDQEGQDIATRLRYSASNLFNDFLAQNGIAQIHLAGDGFICALPVRTHGGYRPDGILYKFIKTYRTLLEKVEDINHRIEDPEAKLGSRLAVHWGEYRFGRVGLARNLVVGFDGPTIIDVARLEAGLRELTKGTVTQGLQDNQLGNGPLMPGLAEYPHTIIFSDQVREVASMFFQDAPPDLEPFGPARIGIKEARLAGAVYGFDVNGRRSAIPGRPSSSPAGSPPDEDD